MNKSLLLAAASMLALSAGGALAAGLPTVAGVGTEPLPPIRHNTETMLYNQNSNNSGVGIVSQNFSSTYSMEYDCAGADDFIVPKGKEWRVDEVDVTGVLFGDGLPPFEDVYFYHDSNGVPGKPVKGGSFIDLNGEDADGSFTIDLPSKLRLAPGHYWLSVVMNANVTWQWGWEGSTTIQNDPAQWENPGGGFGTSCASWGSYETCFGYAQDDMFDLKGTSRNR